MVYDYVTLEAAAGILERHVARLAEAVAFGEIPGVRLDSGQIVIPRMALPPRTAVSEENG